MMIHEMTTPINTAKKVLKHKLGEAYYDMIEAFCDEVFPKTYRLGCTKVQMIGWCNDAMEFLPKMMAEEVAKAKAERQRSGRLN